MRNGKSPLVHVRGNKAVIIIIARLSGKTTEFAGTYEKEGKKRQWGDKTAPEEGGKGGFSYFSNKTATGADPHLLGVFLYSAKGGTKTRFPVISPKDKYALNLTFF